MNAVKKGDDMPYFNYHATVKRLIREGKLRDLRIVGHYHGISPALLLYFDDADHPVMPIREHRFDEYFTLIHTQYPPDAPGGAIPPRGATGTEKPKDVNP